MTGGWAQFLVADDGPGVPPEYGDRIFDHFYRAETARARDGGSGLGLSIAKGLTERNRGRLELVEAGPGRPCGCSSQPGSGRP
jgi:signal transduction histidine kinase